MEEDVARKKWDISLLYVEDDPTTVFSVSEMLRRRVSVLYTASDGNTGLELFKKYRPDIVVTDIRMPEMNGLAMSEAIRNMDENARIIVLTGYSDWNSYTKSADIGIRQYVLKPMKIIELFMAIDSCHEAMLAEHEKEASR